jgi:4-amino-4-deoxy-L-arabinose transferase-like glycosyltransferase
LYESFFSTIAATAFATAAGMGCVLAAVRYFEGPTWRRIVALGLVTGFTVLSSPGTVYFAYALAASLVLYHRSVPSTGIVRAAAFLLAAALVVLPWSIPGNYETFGVRPVRLAPARLHTRHGRHRGHVHARRGA